MIASARIAGAAALCILAATALGGGYDPDSIAGVDFQGGDVQDFIKALAPILKGRWIYDERLHGELSVVAQRGLTPPQVFDELGYLLRLKGFTLLEGRGGETVIVPTQCAASGAQTALCPDLRVERAPAKLAVDPAPADRGPGIPIQFDDADLVDIVETLAGRLGLHIPHDDALQGDATILSDEPATPEQAYAALESALGLHGWKLVQAGTGSGSAFNLVRVSREPGEPPPWDEFQQESCRGKRDHIERRVAALAARGEPEPWTFQLVRVPVHELATAMAGIVQEIVLIPEHLDGEISVNPARTLPLPDFYRWFASALEEQGFALLEAPNGALAIQRCAAPRRAAAGPPLLRPDLRGPVFPMIGKGKRVRGTISGPPSAESFAFVEDLESNETRVERLEPLQGNPEPNLRRRDPRDLRNGGTESPDPGPP